jgi:hypothetical protein
MLENRPEDLTDVQIAAHASDFVIAGSETTATTLSWTSVKSSGLFSSMRVKKSGRVDGFPNLLNQGVRVMRLTLSLLAAKRQRQH